MYDLSNQIKPEVNYIYKHYKSGEYYIIKQIVRHGSKDCDNRIVIILFWLIRVRITSAKK